MIEISKEKLREIIFKGESETIEFKESFNDETLEVIGAFANAAGGMLLVGVQDSGKIVGFQIGKKTVEDVANRIQESTDPRIQPSVLTFVLENKNILIIQINSSIGGPISVRGRFFRRVGKTNQRVEPEEERSAHQRRLGNIVNACKKAKTL